MTSTAVSTHLPTGGEPAAGNAHTADDRARGSQNAPPCDSFCGKTSVTGDGTVVTKREHSLPLTNPTPSPPQAHPAEAATPKLLNASSVVERPGVAAPHFQNVSAGLHRADFYRAGEHALPLTEWAAIARERHVQRVAQRLAALRRSL